MISMSLCQNAPMSKRPVLRSPCIDIRVENVTPRWLYGEDMHRQVDQFWMLSCSAKFKLNKFGEIVSYGFAVYLNYIALIYIVLS